MSKHRDGTKILYRLTPAEEVRMQTVGQIVQGLQNTLAVMLREIAIRQRVTPEEGAVFDGGLMAFVPAPLAPKAP